MKGPRGNKYTTLIDRHLLKDTVKFVPLIKLLHKILIKHGCLFMFLLELKLNEHLNILRHILLMSYRLGL